MTDPKMIEKDLLTTVGIRNDAWLFSFNLNATDWTDDSITLIDEYFTGFQNISLNSRIYVLTENINNSFYLFEVYRKMTGMNLTIELLCKQDESGNEMVHLNRKGIWTRRKNLTGAHLKIGYIPNHSFIYEKDEVQYKITLYI